MTPAPVAIRTVSRPASSATGPARPPASPAPVAATFAYGGPSFIQVAAVSDNGRAEWLANYLKPFGNPVMQPIGSGMNRVRIRPLNSVERAQAAPAKVHTAGFTDAGNVVDAPAGGVGEASSTNDLWK